MIRNQKNVPASGVIILILVLVSALALKGGYMNSEKWYWVLILTLPLLLLAILNIRQNKHALTMWSRLHTLYSRHLAAGIFPSSHGPALMSS